MIVLALWLNGLAAVRSAHADDGDPQREPPRTETLKLEPLVVMGATPVPGLGQPLDRIPGNVQQLNADDVDALAPLSATDLLGRRAGSVHLGHTQNNPYQPDVIYRGFTSSFLLGTPQGLSVFQDGVRLNDFLGDSMNWDLVPESSLRTMEIVPGANPLYGRNTLGGAIALQTKSGRTSPGSSAELSYGSFGRFDTKVSQGGVLGADQAFDYFVLGDFARETGFRDFSRSRVGHLFLRGGWRGPAQTELWLTYDLARNKLRGNGSVPESLLDGDRSAVFTQPDLSEPELDFATLHLGQPLSRSLRFDATGYFRSLGMRQFNADAADHEDDDDDDEEPEDGGDDVSLPGVVNRARIDQRRFGGTLQSSHVVEADPLANFFALGFDGEGGDADVGLTQEAGTLTADRGVATAGDPQRTTDVSTWGDSIGAYATDTVTPLSWLSFTGSLRYDRTHIVIENHLAPESGGDHVFDRVNPAAGVNARLGDRMDLYAHYGESFRAPSAIELTCANEDDPCPLPIAFADDPPLRKVVAESYEVGVRARPFENTRTSAAFFLTNLDDDILFVASSRAAGFFQNVGATRRMGVEANADGRLWSVSWFLSYAFTRATFESTASFPSAASDDNVARPGDELPGVPRHLLKAGFDAELPWGFRAGADLQHVGTQFLRGDESNQRRPLSAFAVANARLSYTWRQITLFARAENLFDAEYETSGVFGENTFAGGRVERFLSPGAPLGGWFGMRIDLGS